MRSQRSLFPRLLAALLLTLAVSGCKLVSDAEREAKRAAAEGDADVVGATVARVWEAEALPHIRKTAAPFPELAAAMKADFDAAGQKHGYRQKSEGSPWNFSTDIRGVIVSANTKSRAASADIDINGDGKADAILQLGPVIRGTALRDVLPFIAFTDFRDQIEFAKLARAFNTKAYEGALQDAPRDGLIGAKVEAVGVFTMRRAGDAIRITPIELKLETGG